MEMLQRKHSFNITIVNKIEVFADYNSFPNMFVLITISEDKPSLVSLCILPDHFLNFLSIIVVFCCSSNYGCLFLHELRIKQVNPR